MKLELGKHFSELPSWAKGVVAIVVIGGIGFAGYKIYKGIQKAQNTKGESKEKKDVNADLNQEIKSGKAPTLSDSQISGYANQLKASFDGYGTDNATVGRVFSAMNNDADILLLIKDYGTKTISSGKFNTTPDFTGTLPETISDEMSSDDIATYITANLVKKGIKYRF